MDHDGALSTITIIIIIFGKRHCERSFGTNVLVLGKQRDNLPLLSEPLETDVDKNVVIETLSKLETLF